MAIAAEDVLTERAPSVAPTGYATLILRNRQLMVGLIIVLTILGAAIVGTFAFDANLRRTGAVPRKLPPSASQILGTTSVGQSVAAQMSEAIPNSMLVGLIAASLGTLIGATM